MANVTGKFDSQHALAASTQSKLRNGRRVVHREVSPVDDDASEVIAAADAKREVALVPVAESPVVHHAMTISPLDLPAEQFRSGLDRRKQNRQLLLEWVRSALVEGVDFGRVHIASKDKCEHARAGRVRDCTNTWHWSKPSLFKPGAEKITGMLGMTVHYPSLPAFEQAVLAGNAITCILLRCELHDAQGRVVAEGVGARNLSQDYGDFNKSLKMAEKSAHIDATLRLAGLSEVFTQDLEDRSAEEEIAAAAPAKAASRTGARKATGKPSVTSTASSASSASTASSASSVAVELIGADEVAGLRERILELGFTEQRVLTWLTKTTEGRVRALEQLSVKQCVTLLQRLDAWAAMESASLDEEEAA